MYEGLVLLGVVAPGLQVIEDVVELMSAEVQIVHDLGLAVAAKEATGGDFEVEEGHIRGAVGDELGHGMQESLIKAAEPAVERAAVAMEDTGQGASADGAGEPEVEQLTIFGAEQVGGAQGRGLWMSLPELVDMGAEEHERAPRRCLISDKLSKHLMIR